MWYVELAPITHPDLVPLTVARALGLPDRARKFGRSTRSCGSSATAAMLMVLDNCEHLARRVRDVDRRRIARCVPGVTLLATSREPIGAGGRGHVAGAVAVAFRRSHRVVH